MSNDLSKKFNKSRITKKTIKPSSEGGNQWLSNAMRSIGYSAHDVLTNVMPATMGVVDTVQQNSQDIIDSLRQKKTQLKRLDNIFEQNAYVGMGKDLFKRSLADLKSGKFYDKERSSGGFGLGDDLNFDMPDSNFDDLWDSGDYDISASTNDGSTSIGVNRNSEDGSDTTITTVSTKIADDSAMVKAVGHQTQASIANTSAMMELMKRHHILSSQKITELYNGVMSGFSTLNDNIARFTPTISKSLESHMALSAKYYNDSINVLTEIKTGIVGIGENTKSANPNKPMRDPKDSKYKDVTDLFDISGMIDLKEYVDFVKGNLSKSADGGNMILSMGKLLYDNRDMLTDIKDNPLKFISDGIVNTIIPSVVKEVATQFDDTFRSTLMTSLYKLRGMRNDNNPIKSFIGEIFGIHNRVQTSIDTSNYNKDRVEWNGISHMTLNNVIPTYLRKILAAITNSQEYVFDYTNGVWSDLSTIRENAKKSDESAYLGDYTQVFSDFKNEFLSNFSFADDKQRVKVEDAFRRYIKNVILTDGGTDFKESSIAKMLGMPEYSPYVQIIRSFFDTRKNSENMEFFGEKALSSRRTLTRYFQDKEADPVKNNQIYLNSGTDSVMVDDIAFLRDSHGRLNGVRNEDFIEGGPHTTHISGMAMGNRDKYNRSATYYTRSILELLLSGIDVRVVSGLNGVSVNNGNGSNNTPNSIRQKLKDDETEFITRNMILRSRDAYDSTIHPSGIDDEYEQRMRQQNPNIASIDIDTSTIQGSIYGDRDEELDYRHISRVVEDRMIREQETIDSIDELNLDGQSTSFRDLIGLGSETPMGRIVDSMKRYIQRPALMLGDILKHADDALFRIVFGEGGNSTMVSLMDRATHSMADSFKNFNDWMNSKLLTPLSEAFFGDDGFVTKLKDSTFGNDMKNYLSKAREFVFGKVDDNGINHGGLLSSVANEVKDAARYLNNHITGKAYIDQYGEEHPENTDSLLHKTKAVINKGTEFIRTKIFGLEERDPNDHSNSIVNAINDIWSSIKNRTSSFVDDVFGSSDDPNNTKRQALDQFKYDMEGQGGRLVLGAGVGLLGAGILSSFGGLGIAGSMLLSPIGGAALGLTAAIATKSSQLQRLLFGEIDEDGNRMGGLITKGMQDFVKDGFGGILAGGALGATMSSMGLIPELGLVGSMLFPGGPVLTTAIVGGATAIGLKATNFGKAIFGDHDGSVQSFSERFSNMFDGAKFKDVAMDAGVGALIGGGLVNAVSSMGLLPAFFGPAGPILGAAFGLSTSIISNTDKFRTFMFGDKDENGIRDGGIVGKISDNLHKVGQKITTIVQTSQENIVHLAKTKIAIPIQATLDPMIEEIKEITVGIKDKIFNTLETTFDVFKKTLVKYVVEPIADATKPIRDALKKAGNFIFKFMSKLFTGIITAPAKIGMSAIALPFQIAGGIFGVGGQRRQKRRARNAYMQSTLGVAFGTRDKHNDYMEQYMGAQSEDNPDGITKREARIDAMKDFVSGMGDSYQLRQEGKTRGLFGIKDINTGEYISTGDGLLSRALFNNGFINAGRTNQTYHMRTNDGTFVDRTYGPTTDGDPGKIWARLKREENIRHKEELAKIKNAPGTENDDKRIRKQAKQQWNEFKSKYYIDPDTGEIKLQSEADGKVSLGITKDEFIERAIKEIKAKQPKWYRADTPEERAIKDERKRKAREQLEEQSQQTVVDVLPQIQDTLTNLYENWSLSNDNNTDNSNVEYRILNPDESEDALREKVFSSTNKRKGIRSLVEDMMSRTTIANPEPTDELVLTDVQTYADGSEYIPETQMAILSEGEMVIPNPDPEEREKNRKSEISFKNKLSESREKFSSEISKMSKLMTEIRNNIQYEKANKSESYVKRFISHIANTVLNDPMKFITDIVTAPFKLVGKAIDKLGAGIYNHIVGPIIDTIETPFIAISEGIKEASDKLISAATYPITIIQDAAHQVMIDITDSITKPFKDFHDGVVNTVDTVMFGILHPFKTIKAGINAFESVFGNPEDEAPNVIQSILNRVHSTTDSVKSFFGDLYNDTTNANNDAKTTISMNDELNDTTEYGTDVDTLVKANELSYQIQSEQNENKQTEMAQITSMIENQEDGSYSTIREKQAEIEKEKQTQDTLTAIATHTQETAESSRQHASSWLSIFGKKGLITGALIAALPLIAKLLSGGLSGLIGGVNNVVNNISSWMDYLKNNWSNGDTVYDDINGDGKVGPLEMLVDDIGYGIHTVGNGTGIVNNIGEGFNDVNNLIANLIASDNLGDSGAAILNYIAPGGEWDNASDVKSKVVLKGAKNVTKFGLKVGSGIAKLFKNVPLPKFGNIFNKTGLSLTDSMSKNATKLAHSLEKKMAKNAFNATKLSTNTSKNATKLAHSLEKKMAKNAFNATKSGSMSKNATKLAHSLEKKMAKNAFNTTKLSTNSGLLDNVIKLSNKGISLLDDALRGVTTKLGSGMSKGAISSITKTISSKLSGIAAKLIKPGILSKYLGKFGTAISKVAGAVGTGGLLDAAFITAGAINGAYSAANLFQVNQDAIDGKMRAISSVIEGLLMTGIGTIIDILDTICFEVFGFSFISDLAVTVYNAFATEEEKNAILLERTEFKNDYEAYIEDEYQLYLTENNLTEDQYSKEEYRQSEEATTFSDYNSQVNQTLGSKIWDGIKTKYGVISDKLEHLGAKTFTVTDAVVTKVKDFGSDIKYLWDNTSDALSGTYNRIKDSVNKFFRSQVNEGYYDPNDGTYYVLDGDIFKMYSSTGTLLTDNIPYDTIIPFITSGQFVKGPAYIESGLSAKINEFKTSILEKVSTNWDNLKSFASDIKDVASERLTDVRDFFLPKNSTAYYNIDGSYYVFNGKDFDEYNVNGVRITKDVPYDNVMYDLKKGLLTEGPVMLESGLSTVVNEYGLKVTNAVKTGWNMLGDWSRGMMDDISNAYTKSKQAITNAETAVMNFFIGEKQVRYVDSYDGSYYAMDGDTFSRYTINGELLATGIDPETVFLQYKMGKLSKTEVTVTPSGISELKDTVINGISSIYNNAKDKAKEFFGKAGNVFATIYDTFGDVVTKFKSGAFTTITSLLTSTADALISITNEDHYYILNSDGKTYSYYNAGELINDKVDAKDVEVMLENDLLYRGKVPTKPKIKDVASKISQFASDTWDNVVSAAKTAWDAIKNAFTGGYGDLQNIAPKVEDAIVESGARDVDNVVNNSNTNGSGGFGNLKPSIGGFGSDDAKGSSSVVSEPKDWGSSDHKYTVSQKDSNIASIKFNRPDDTITQTIGDSGCGPVLASNLVNRLVGDNTLSVKDAAEYALDNGYKAKDNGTSPNYFSSILGEYGIHTTMGKSDIKESLTNHKPVIMLGRNDTPSTSTPFGTVPHYIVAMGMSNDGKIIVQDPLKKRGYQKYKLNDMGDIYSTIRIDGFDKLSDYQIKRINKFKGSIKDLDIRKYGKGGTLTIDECRTQDLRVYYPITAQDIEDVIKAKNSRSYWVGKGHYFIQAGIVSGIDPRFLFSLCVYESGWEPKAGYYHREKHNYFSINMPDGGLDKGLVLGDTDEEGIINGALWIAKNYIHHETRKQYTIQRMRTDPEGGGTHCYNTRTQWEDLVATIMAYFPKTTNYDSKNLFDTGKVSTCTGSGKYLGLSYNSTTPDGTDNDTVNTTTTVVSNNITTNTGNTRTLGSVLSNLASSVITPIKNFLFGNKSTSSDQVSSYSSINGTDVDSTEDVQETVSESKGTVVNKLNKTNTSVHQWMLSNVGRQINSYKDSHKAVDYKGTAKSPSDGVVTEVGSPNPYWGQYVKISGVDGKIHEFSSLLRPLVKKGTVVKQGDSIGKPGQSFKYEKELGDHIHYAVRDKNDIRVGSGINPSSVYLYSAGGLGDNWYADNVLDENSPNSINNFTYFSQNDPRFANLDYKLSDGYDDNGIPETIGARGCGPTALAMVATELTGNLHDPHQLSNIASQGLYSTDLGTTPEYFTNIGHDLGLGVSQLRPNRNKLIYELRNGKPVILQGTSMNTNTPYTDQGHYVVAVGTKNGKILINDPNGEDTSGEYMINDVINDSGMMWSFDNSGKNPIVKYNQSNIIGRQSYRSEPYPDVMNGHYYFSQGDPRWGDKIYAGGTSFGSAGCVVTSIAQAVSDATGTRIDPPTAVDAMGKNSFSGASILWEPAMQGLKNKYGINYEFYDGPLKGGHSASETSDYIRNKLRNNIPLSVFGSFTKGQMGLKGSVNNHAIDAVAITNDDKAIINDPGYFTLTSSMPEKAYDINTMGKYTGKIIAVTDSNGNGSKTPTSQGYTNTYQSDISTSNDDSIGGVLGDLANAITNPINNYLFGIDTSSGVLTSNISSGSTGGATTGSNNKEKIWNFFKQRNYSDNLVAGIMGNMERESGYDWQIMQGGRRSAVVPFSSGGYGLIQWTGPLAQRIADNQAKALGTQGLNSLGGQLEVVAGTLEQNRICTIEGGLTEGTNGSAFNIHKFKSKYGEDYFNKINSMSVNDATTAFHDCVEISADGSMSKRQQFAQSVLDEYGGKGVISGFGNGVKYKKLNNTRPYKPITPSTRRIKSIGGFGSYNSPTPTNITIDNNNPEILSQLKSIVTELKSTNVGINKFNDKELSVNTTSNSPVINNTTNNIMSSNSNKSNVKSKKSKSFDSDKYKIAKMIASGVSIK